MRFKQSKKNYFYNSLSSMEKKKTQPNTVITECYNLQISTAQFCHLKYELPLKVAGDCFRQWVSQIWEYISCLYGFVLQTI